MEAPRLPLAQDLIGIWRGARMFRPRSQVYETLAFREDGTGMLELYDKAQRFCDEFRWHVTESDRVHFEGQEISVPDQGLQNYQRRRSSLFANTHVRIQLDDVRYGGNVRVLRFAVCPWQGTSEHFRFGGNGRVQATFIAEHFVDPEEADDPIHRGKKLSNHLAKELKARSLDVSEMMRVYFGASYGRNVVVNGRDLNLAVNWDEAPQAWWVGLDPPGQGRGDELEILRGLVAEILEAVPGLRDLKWHTTAEMIELDRKGERAVAGRR